MKNIAPHIVRQRLLIEGYYSIELNREIIEKYLYGVAQHLALKTYGKPVIYSPGGEGKEENQGFDAFIPLIDSGISAYFWSKQRFFSILLYTCKHFDESAAIAFTQQFFAVERETVHQSF